MSEGTLVIGTKRYSSWSLRGWLAVRLAGLDVAERVIPLAGTGAGGTPAVVQATPAGLVPYLEHRGARAWESLAICEYCAEITPSLWPADRVARAAARSIAAEMHAGVCRPAPRHADEPGPQPPRRPAIARGGGRHRPDRGHLARRPHRRPLPIRRHLRRGPTRCTPPWSPASCPTCPL